METFIVILVLIILFVLLGGTAWFFGKEAGPGNGFSWLTGTRQFRSMVQPFSSKAQEFTNSRQSAVMIDDSRLLELAEELQGEITRASAMAEHFEMRMVALEREIGHTRQLPQTIDARVQSAESETRSRINKLRQELNQSRKSDSPYSLKRNDAVGKLYQRLAQLEVALGNVINPMLLPGEPVSVPDSLHDDTLQWENWGDVADRAFGFGEQFSQTRFLLEPELAERIETFISNFREALTGTVYPIVQGDFVNAKQKATMRDGIVTVVEGITPLRREFERTWLNGTALTEFPNEENNDLEDN